MTTPKPGERYAIAHATLVVTVRHVYDGGSVRFIGAPNLQGIQALGQYGNVATASQWAALNPRRLTPRKGDVWLLRFGPSDRTEVEVLYVYPDGDVCHVYPDGEQTSCSSAFWEALNPSLVGTYAPLFTLFGKGFGKKLVTI